jgi:hypothetical protein
MTSYGNQIIFFDEKHFSTAEVAVYQVGGQI